MCFWVEQPIEYQNQTDKTDPIPDCQCSLCYEALQLRLIERMMAITAQLEYRTAQVRKLSKAVEMFTNELSEITMADD